MKTKIVLIMVLALLIVGGGIVYVAGNVLAPRDSNPSTVGNKVINPEPQEKETEVNLYYVNSKYIETGDESLAKTLPVKKKIKYGKVPFAEAVVKELFKDPGIEGLSAGVPQSANLLGVEVEGDTAYVNFASQGLNGGSTAETIVIEQITKTLFGLEGISRVQFLKDGKKADDLMGHIDVRKPFIEEMTVNELQLGDIKLYTKRDEFLKKYGEPLATKIEQNGIVEKLEYQDFKVTITDKEVSEIVAASGKYPTTRGLKVGDSLEQVLNLHGEPSSKHGDIWSYKIGPEYELLHIKISNGKVIEIRIHLAC